MQLFRKLNAVQESVGSISQILALHYPQREPRADNCYQSKCVVSVRSLAREGQHRTGRHRQP